ncbi:MULTISPECIES: hypothetical protein [Enterococcus]|uniref:hypothetical protein n=1 Tax=Enterococcus TaxID=1350 RepID=UPI001F5E15E4|nr:hypothetical protein [Enterococcus sp. MJM16]
MNTNNTCDFQIGRLDGEKYVIMQNFQSMAEFWKRNNGGITVQYTLSFQKLDMPDTDATFLREIFTTGGRRMKTIKHKVYKHGSYLYALKGAGFESLSIDSEIKKMEKLHQIAPSSTTIEKVKLNDNQLGLLKDIEMMWTQREQHELSYKTAAVFEVLNSDFEYEVYGNDIDEVVKIFIGI